MRNMDLKVGVLVGIVIGSILTSMVVSVAEHYKVSPLVTPTAVHGYTTSMAPDVLDLPSLIHVDEDGYVICSNRKKS